MSLPLSFVFYIVLSGYSLMSNAAVQKAPEVSFFADYVSKFHYQSHTNVATGINLTLSAQVSGSIRVSMFLFIRCYGNKRANNIFIT